MPESIGSKLQRAYAQAALRNSGFRPVMSSPPTVTANGTSKPAAQTNGYTYVSKPALFRFTGGLPVAISGSGGGYRVKAAVIASTGGNLSDGAGGNGCGARVDFDTDAAVVSFGLGPSTVPYRFIVNGSYVDLTGTITSNTSSSANTEYITLDFGSRLNRNIVLEMQQNNAFQGVHVGATDTVHPSSSPSTLRSVLLGDSYAEGSGATVRGDGWSWVMADYLGLRAHQSSGSGGTGWATANASYRFDQRITNGDLGLGGTPDIIFLMGSYNDRNLTAATITANCLSGLQTARSRYPSALIFVFGAFPANSGPSAGILSAENAVSLAVTTFGDVNTFFIPISTDTSSVWISGTGREGTTTGSGNSDVYTSSDQTHPSASGHLFLGRRAATAVASLYSQIP